MVSTPVPPQAPATPLPTPSAVVTAWPRSAQLAMAFLLGVIVAERQKKPFASVEDLRRVPRLGPKTLERLRPHVTVVTPTGGRGV